MSLADANANKFFSFLGNTVGGQQSQIPITNKALVEARMHTNPLISAMRTGFSDFRQDDANKVVLRVKHKQQRPLSRSDAEAMRRYAQFTKNMEKMSVPLADPAAGPTADMISNSARNPFLHKQISLRGLVKSRKGLDALRCQRFGRGVAVQGNQINNVTATISMRSLKVIE